MSDKQTTLATLRRALEFYANPQRYCGSNQNPTDGDPYQPETCPYLWDVGRDGGEIARKALRGE